MRPKIVQWTLAVASIVVGVSLGPSPASADVQAFMKFPGLAGESTNDRHKGEIDVVTYNQNAGGNACFKAIVVKNLDTASPGLAVLAITNQVVTPVTIALEQTGDTPRTIFTAVLENVVVGTVELMEADYLPVPSERVTLRPRRVTLTYNPQKPDGSLGAPIVTVVTCP